MVDPNYPGFHGLEQDSSPLQYCGSARRYTPTRSPEQKQRSQHQQHQQQQPSSSSSSSGHYYYNRQHSNNSHKLSLTLLSKHRQPSLISTSTIFGSKRYCDMDYPVKGRGLYQSHHHSHRASSPSHPPLHRSISPGASGSPQTPPPHPGGVLTTSICDTKFLLTGSGPNSRDGGGGESSLSHHEPLGSTNSVRKVHIIKSPDDPPDVGLTLCGGLEVGLGGTIFISRVAEDSIAEKSGLCPGDQILSINYTSFLDQSVTCQKALHMICSQDCLTFTILPRREALTSHRRNVAYNWVDPEGRPVSPPPPDRDFNSDTELDLLGEPGGPSASSRVTSSPRRRQSHSNRSCEQIVRTVKIIIEKGINPGLMIRGGLEYGLGIYVTGVESMSAAERGGLKIGDQILFVNNHDFRNVLHDEAVDILRSSPRLTMKVRYVGKTPASNASLVISSSSTNSHLTSSDGSTSSASHADYPLNRIPSSSRCSLNSETRRINRSSCSSRHTSSGTGSPGYRSISEQGTNHVTPTLLVTESAEEELLEEKLNQLLPEKDRITFAYYRNEYETKGMTVDAFIALFLELLDTREKYSLLNHFRSIIREEDLDKFDELIYKREEQAMIKSKANPIEAAHMIADDEDLSDCSISFPHESIGNGHHKENDSIPLDTKSSKITSSPIERSSSRNGNNSARFGRDINSLSPLPFNKDSVPRRHSSCNPEKDISNCNDFLTIPTNPDERRWSIAASHDLPSKYNKDSAYGYRENLRERSLSGVEMKSNGRDNTIHHQRTSSSNHLQIPNVNNNIYHSADQLPETGYHSSLQSKVRRHSSLPGPCSTNPLNKPSSPFHCQPHRSSSFRIPHHRSVREPDGKLRVIVKKSKPILGLAIEGGSDVPSQLQPRIISIHSSGAAFDTGDLHVGHIILEVDGVSTANMSHEEVAQMMAMAYYNTPYKDHIEFVVREKSKNEFDIRRSSFMLLNNSFE